MWGQRKAQETFAMSATGGGGNDSISKQIIENPRKNKNIKKINK